MRKYQYPNAYEWLKEQSATWTPAQLRHELLELALAAGDDAIQDRYQEDMDRDGYFTELTEEEAP